MSKKTPSNHKRSLKGKRQATKPPVFQDPGQRRAALVRGGAMFLLTVAVSWVVLFSLSLYYVAKVSPPGLLTARAGTESAFAAEPSALTMDQTDAQTQIVSLTPPVATDTRACGSVSGTTISSAVAQTTASPRIYAYFPAASDWANLSLARDCGMIDVLLPDWYGLDLSAGAASKISVDEDGIKKIQAHQRSTENPEIILPILTILQAKAGVANADFLSDPTLYQRLADDAARLVADNDYAGLCINPGDLATDDPSGFNAFFSLIKHRLSEIGRQTCLVVAAQDPLWYDTTITGAADLVVLLAFKEAWSAIQPGPPAAQAWFEQTIAEAVAAIGTDRLVVALGSFGYDWVSDNPVPEEIGYAEAMRRAARHNGQMSFPSDTLNTNIHLVDERGLQHSIWLLDAASLHNQRVVLEKYKVAGMAVWPLGLEDPTIWPALATGTPEQTESIVLEDYVGYDGNGPFMHILHSAEAGLRHLVLDADSGLIQDQSYSKIPQPYSIQRFGAGADDTIVLTFDDGPDSAYTPAILDILDAENVPATFFLVGSSILKWPDVVRRMVDDGHEIGSHTFFHPDTENISDLRQKLELNALQRLVISVTGHSTALFRTPYGRGPGPLTAAEARPFLTLDQGGYIVVGSNIVPRDWENLSPEEIVTSTMTQLKPTGGNVIVMHDGGGDRSATVAALPMLISALRAKGYRFVSLADMLSVEREALMPLEHGTRATLDLFSFTLLKQSGTILRAIFWVAIILGFTRSLFILSLALLRRPHRDDDTPYTPTVTVVIPAFNEEEVILASIQTVLSSDYPDLRLIVIDDGSQDHTYDRVATAYADNPRVWIIHEPNQGKWMALDTAYAYIKTEVVVAIDADTIIPPDAIRKLVRAFRDPKVGAVAGKVQVGNRGTLLTKLQALEYTVAQNIDRRAAEVFNGIMVVPGAIGAWRTEAVRKAGLYTSETVAEDADLTVSVLRAGYRVAYEENAVSITEAPETLHGFMKQRLRWTFGMMQTAWKHRRAAREGRAVGLISIPDLWLFGVVLALLAPIADLVFFGVVLDMSVNAVVGRPLLESPVSMPILAGYLVLPLIDVLAALMAFGFERKAPWLVLLIPVQRLFYRQLLYITVYRATWRALVGKIAGWGKLVRLGTVRLPGT